MINRLRLLLPLAVLAALLALPAAASAVLVYNTGFSSPQPSLWSAANDGSQRVKLGRGYTSPRVSPDGTKVIALRYNRSSTSLYALSTAAAGPAQLLLRNADFYVSSWSPDSKSVAVATGRRVILIDIASGAVTTLASGFTAGSTVSFSPAGDMLAYSTAASSRLNARTNVYVVPVAGGAPTQLTTDGQSSSPVWGPTRIAYSRGPFRHNDYPKLQVWTMNPDGSDQRQLTNVRVRQLVSGLSPVQWSVGGGQLLANYGGQDTSQAYSVDPVSGYAFDLGVHKFDGTTAFALSRDGTQVLAQTGGVDSGPGIGQNVVTIPFTGGPPTILVRGGLFPDWNA
jgi:dipeptidyl aminopeptidase/acylaminoacyl peptidase